MIHVRCLSFFAEKEDNGDERLEKIATRVIENHGYAAVHPLTRNW